MSKEECFKNLTLSFIALLKLIESQAMDEGLWFPATTAAEAYIQQELRKLHGAVERVSADFGKAMNK